MFLLVQVLLVSLAWLLLSLLLVGVAVGDAVDIAVGLGVVVIVVHVLPLLLLPCFACLALPCLALPYLTLPHLASLYRTLPYPTLPYPTLPHPTLPHRTSPYPTPYPTATLHRSYRHPSPTLPHANLPCVTLLGLLWHGSRGADDVVRRRGRGGGRRWLGCVGYECQRQRHEKRRERRVDYGVIIHFVAPPRRLPRLCRRTHGRLCACGRHRKPALVLNEELIFFSGLKFQKGVSGRGRGAGMVLRALYYKRRGTRGGGGSE